MFWSHADQQTYEAWLTALQFRIDRTMFIPEGNGGHTAVLAQRIDDNRIERGSGEVADGLTGAVHP